MKIEWRLLRQSITFSQLVGFFLSGFIGILIILLGIQLGRDVRSFFDTEDGFIKKDYLVITKKVGTLSMLNKQGTVFSEGEIENLKEQSFVDQLGVFTASRFRVVGGIEIQQMGMSFQTEMFFESVPDEFIDVKSSSWGFNENSDIIPIILPRNYLNLYNFGFAQSRNLPKISEGVMGMIQLNIRLSGNGQQRLYKGNIIGFSNRLNTILVPQEFMDWANQTYASDRSTINPSRLIIETDNKNQQEAVKYFRNNSYEVENDKLESGNMTWFFNIIIALVVLIGVLISILSFYLLILNFYLILERNSDRIQNLLLLGYSYKQIAKPFITLAIVLNGIICIVSLLVMFIIRSQLLPKFKELWSAYTSGGVLYSILITLFIFFLFTFIHILSINKRVKKIDLSKSK